MNDQRKRLGLDIERVWIVDQVIGPALVFRGPRPDQNAFPNAVQYMRVLSRDEVEKLALREGVDTQQLMNSYLRTIEGQRREINRLNGKQPDAPREVWTDEFGRRCSKAIPGTYEGDHWCVGATKRGTVCARDAAAARKLFKELTGEDALKCARLPYGASPFLNLIVYEGGSTSAQGGFCFDPDNCMGRSACPKGRACSE